MVGSLNAGLYDLRISMPSGRSVSLRGPLGMQNGTRYLLQHKPAASVPAGFANENCYLRNDRTLNFCIGGRLD